MKFKRTLYINDKLKLLVFEYNNGLYGLYAYDDIKMMVVGVAKLLMSLIRTDGFKKSSYITVEDIKIINQYIDKHYNGFEKRINKYYLNEKYKYINDRYNKEFIKEYKG